MVLILKNGQQKVDHGIDPRAWLNESGLGIDFRIRPTESGQLTMVLNPNPNSEFIVSNRNTNPNPNPESIVSNPNSESMVSKPNPNI